MKSLMFFTLLFVFSNTIFSQTKVSQASDSAARVELKVFDKVEKPAEFPGSSEGWRSYLEKNLKYPKKARKAEIQGVVRVQFIVDKTGVVSEIAILSDPGSGLGEEVVRLISSGPKWIPAEQEGKKVSYRHIQAITFKLE